MKKLLIFFFALATISNFIGQEQVIKELLEDFRLIKTSAITNNTDVVGYYSYYKGERNKNNKSNNRTFNYKLRIYDENMETVTDKHFERSVHDILKESEFNNDYILFKFLNLKEEKVKFIAFDGNGEIAFDKEREMEKFEYRMLKASSSNHQSGPNLNSNTLEPITGKGFVDYFRVKNNKEGFGMNFISNSGEIWKRFSKESSKLVERADFIGYDDTYLYTLISKSKSLNKKEYDIYIQANELETGKRKFHKKIDDDRYDINPLNAFVDKTTNEVKCLSTVYNDGEGLTGIPIGLQIATINVEGKFVDKKEIIFELDLSKFTEVKQTGKLKEFGNMYFHNIVPTKDGYIFIAESYKKEISGAGVALKLLGAGGNISAVQITLGNFIVISTNSDFDVTGFDVLEKPKRAIYLPEGSLTVSPGRLGHYVKNIGKFALKFDHMYPDENLYYGIYRQINNKDKTAEIGIVKVKDGQVSTEEFSIGKKIERFSTGIFRAKKGHFYLVKRERVDKVWQRTYSMEKINL